MHLLVPQVCPLQLARKCWPEHRARGRLGKGLARKEFNGNLPNFWRLTLIWWEKNGVWTEAGPEFLDTIERMEIKHRDKLWASAGRNRDMSTIKQELQLGKPRGSQLDHQFHQQIYLLQIQRSLHWSFASGGLCHTVPCQIITSTNSVSETLGSSPQKPLEGLSSLSHLQLGSQPNYGPISGNKDHGFSACLKRRRTSPHSMRRASGKT